MQERDDWVQRERATNAVDQLYVERDAEPYCEVGAGWEQATKGTIAPDQSYPSAGQAEPYREQPREPAKDEWRRDERPGGQEEFPLSGAVAPAERPVDRDGWQQAEDEPATLAPEALVVSAVIVQAPMSGDREGPWLRRARGTVAPDESYPTERSET
jgi:hypothetical protein